MKASICATIAAAVIAIPSFAFAQADTSGNAPITRAQVGADLVRVEQAGYNPASSDINYPADIQAAEAKLNADHAYGGVSNGSANGAAVQN
ncbi:MULTISPECIES: DUF4148 domain-containing protein [Burkholderiaceae]|uniref:Purine nucleoside phosphorylase n=1 Tax=Caballeronia sordidicola TaxID=196367 RepID=A0A242MN36_CABSO|nr:MULTISPECIES: DUF4148 domain-containing protein [Burkholderiaceae]AME26005.1 hypothetical protein AXG89_18945 [Burkholderia sp. PAMC 26561]OTP72590.1 hypothetical protein PAMC26577_20020 [Caballeronia sordidicola]